MKESDHNKRTDGLNEFIPQALRLKSDPTKTEVTPNIVIPGTLSSVMVSCPQKHVWNGNSSLNLGDYVYELDFSAT